MKKRAWHLLIAFIPLFKQVLAPPLIWGMHIPRGIQSRHMADSMHIRGQKRNNGMRGCQGLIRVLSSQ